MAKIQFEDKVALNENSNIPDVNKCKATDMNEIKSVVNGNDDLVGNLRTLNTTDKSSIVGAINEVYQSNVYSTDETVVGKWIDGKPIYRKVINSICGNLRTLLNELNIDFLIDTKGTAWSNYDHRMPINAPNPEPPNYVFGIYQSASTNNISVFYNADFYNDTNKVIVTVIYTKTTD